MERTRLPRQRLVARRLAWIPRGAAWAALIVATGLMVQAEIAAPVAPEGVETYAGIVYRRDGGRRLALDLAVPTGPVPPGGRPVIVAIHGGGWRGGGRADFGRTVARLGRHGLAVATIDYTLSRPGAPSWPANLQDVREAVRWVRRNADRFGLDPDRVGVLGASAGGHLATLVGLAPGDPEVRVKAVVSLYGPADLPALGKPCLLPGGPVDLLLGGLPADQPERARAATPIHHVSAAAPPMFLIHGADDELVPPEQSRRLAGALERAGVPHRLLVLDDAAHGFGLTVAERDLVPEILAFLHDSWNDGSHPR